MKLNKESKRLGIYFFYDSEGIVDDYIVYFLKDLVKNLDELCIVCNGKLNSEGKSIFKQLTSTIIVRENKGFDVWAYKAAINHYGWETLTTYDEVVFLNFTIMGPLYPFQVMFDEMAKRDIDFWGITKHAKVDQDPFDTISYGYLPEHIQSHFLAFRRDLMLSKPFQDFWNKMKMVKSYQEAVGFYEAVFTKKFEDLGFKSDSYINTTKLFPDCDNATYCYPMEMVRDHNCPIFKRKIFALEYQYLFHQSSGELVCQLYDYLDQQTDYNTDYIWDNILRTENMANIKRAMHLNYVIPSRGLLSQSDKGNRLALVIFVEAAEDINYIKPYLLSFSSNTDIVIFLKEKKIQDEIMNALSYIKHVDIRTVFSSDSKIHTANIINQLKNFISNYDFLAVVSAAAKTKFSPCTIEESLLYKSYESLFPSEDFVENVITTFYENKRLGMLTPPPPNHSNYSATYGFEWGEDYDLIASMLASIHFSVPISEELSPIAPTDGMFWLRTAALKSDAHNTLDILEPFIISLLEDEKPVTKPLSLLLAFLLQDARYYSAWILSDKSYAIELTNHQFMLTNIYHALTTKMGFNLPALDMEKQIKLGLIPKRENHLQRIKNVLKRFVPKSFLRFYKERILKRIT